MPLEYSFLKTEQLPQIFETFTLAFADYYLDMSSVSERIFVNRAVKNGVRYDCSVGVFDGPKLVGVTLVGMDEWLGCPAAFDAGTGIIPDYRGQGIAGKMFDFATPKLRDQGVEKFLLEVLQVNEPAIKAYRAAGFSITRELDCFELKLDEFKFGAEASGAFKITPVDKTRLLSLQDHLDWPPSWETSYAAIGRIPDELVMLGAFEGGRCVGSLAYYPLLNWIVNLVVDRDYRRRGVAAGLLRELVTRWRPDQNTIRLNNVDHSDSAMIGLLQKAGFQLFASQYEMELTL
jgi:ribosomal protein S18 acetylase RimI-like enzyme